MVFSGSGGYGHVAFVNSFDSEYLYTTEGGRESYKVDEYGNYIQDENGNYIREAYNEMDFVNLVNKIEIVV